MKQLNVRLPEKLKEDFSKACEASGMTEASAIRYLMTNFVRAHKRQNGNDEDNAEVTPSKPADKSAKKTSAKRGKKA